MVHNSSIMRATTRPLATTVGPLHANRSDSRWRRYKGLVDIAKLGPCLAEIAMRDQLGPTRCIEIIAQCIYHLRQDARYDNIRMADGFAEPVSGCACRPVALERIQRPSDLTTATLDPFWSLPAMDGTFVNQRNHFIAQPSCERTNAKMATSHRPRSGHQCAPITNDVIKPIEYCRTLDKDFAIIQHQGGHAHQRIERGHLCGIAEYRPRPMFERDPIQPHRDRDAADKKAVVLAN